MSQEVNGRRRVQAVSSAKEWRERLLRARASLPENVGQQKVIEEAIAINPALDTLLNKTRWHNAWIGKNGDPEITEAIEKVAQKLNCSEQSIDDRLGKKRNSRPKK